MTAPPTGHGGPLTLSALNAVDTAVYTATATSDNIDGARRMVTQFRRHRQQLGAPDTLTEAGIVVSR